MKTLILFIILTITATVLSAQKASYVKVIDGVRVMMSATMGSSQLAESGRYATPEQIAARLKEISRDDKVQLKKMASRKKILSSGALYRDNLESVLVLAIGGLCNECPQLHIKPATAYVISEDGICVTNYHVFSEFVSQKGIKLMTVMTIGEKVYAMTDLLQYSEKDDIAVFRVDTRGDRLSPLPLGEDPEVGDEVNIIAHPDNNFYYFSEGVVARYYRNSQQKAEFMHITADFAKGSSGGPLLDNYGNLIGMVAASSAIYYQSNPPTEVQMVLKNAVPLYAIRRLLDIR